MTNTFDKRHDLLDAYLFAESVMSICYSHGIKSTDELKQVLNDFEALKKKDARRDKLIKAWKRKDDTYEDS